MKALISGDPVLYWVGQKQYSRGIEVEYPWEKGISKSHCELWYIFSGTGVIRSQGGPWNKLQPGMMVWLRRDHFYEWRQDPEKPIGVNFFHFDLHAADGRLFDDRTLPEVLQPAQPLLIEQLGRRVVELLWEAYHEGIVKGCASSAGDSVPVPLFETESDRVRQGPFPPRTTGIQFPANHQDSALLCQALNLFRCIVDEYHHLAGRKLMLDEVGLQLFHRRTVCDWALRIQQDLKAVPTVSEMARQSGYGLDHFGRVFRKVMGCGPQEFVVRSRIAQARQLLLDSALSVKQVASELGYSSSFYFSRQFKSMTGNSPTNFRNQHLKDKADIQANTTNSLF